MKIMLKNKKKPTSYVKSYKVSSRLSEEIGRNYHTIDTDPYTWEDYADINSEIYANEVGGFSAKVTCLSDDNLSTPVRNFPDIDSANFWAQQQSDRIMRRTINEVKVLRNLIKELILRIN
jgi:hypothetical protein